MTTSKHVVGTIFFLTIPQLFPGFKNLSFVGEIQEFDTANSLLINSRYMDSTFAGLRIDFAIPRLFYPTISLTASKSSLRSKGLAKVNFAPNILAVRKYFSASI